LDTLQLKISKTVRHCKGFWACVIQLASGDGMLRLDLEAVAEDGINKLNSYRVGTCFWENVWNDLSVLLREMGCQPLPT